MIQVLHPNSIEPKTETEVDSEASEKYRIENVRKQ